MVSKAKPNRFFEPIDLGLNINFDPIINNTIQTQKPEFNWGVISEKNVGHNLNEWGFEPLIKSDDAPKASLGTDIKSMAQDFKKDYDDLSRGLQYMKNDFAPKVKKFTKKIKKTKVVSPFKLNRQFKNPKSYNPDDAYTKA